MPGLFGFIASVLLIAGIAFPTVAPNHAAAADRQVAAADAHDTHAVEQDMTCEAHACPGDLGSAPCCGSAGHCTTLPTVVAFSAEPTVAPGFRRPLDSGAPPLLRSPETETPPPRA